MRKAYRSIIIISGILALISLLLIGDRWANKYIWYNVWEYGNGFIFYTLLFALAIGSSYFILKRKGRGHSLILIAAFLFTVYIFYKEATVWDVQVNYPLRQTVLDWFMFCPMYTALFFGIFSGIYHYIRSGIQYVRNSY